MKHIPVLEKEVLEQFQYLTNVKDGYFLDCTLGNAGHSLAIATRDKLQATSYKFIGIDKDRAAIDLATTNIKTAGLYEKFILVHDDFNNIEEILKNLCHFMDPDEGQRDLESRNSIGKSTSWIPDPMGADECQATVRDDKYDNDGLKIDGTLIDLGVSSMQLDDRERGFSFMDRDAELDMRMDKEQELDAKEIVNHYSEERLDKILRDYGEEKFAKRIAKNICINRKIRLIQTVGDLLWNLERSIPIKIQKTSKSHFATNTFRALRIEVNNELGDLSKTLKTIVTYLKPGARLAVITFHSTEDRIVKNTFRELSTDCVCPAKAPICTCNHSAEVTSVTKKPIVPTDEEIFENPRSRSAKLRVVERNE